MTKGTVLDRGQRFESHKAFESWFDALATQVAKARAENLRGNAAKRRKTAPRAAHGAWSRKDRAELMRAISKAAEIYNLGRYWDGERWGYAEDFRNTYHELEAPLASVIDILKRVENRRDVLISFGAPNLDPRPPHLVWPCREDLRGPERDPVLSPYMGWPERDWLAVKRADARRRLLLRFLDKLARTVPPSPHPRLAHRPIRTNQLRAAVEILIDYWELATCKRFTSHWHEGEPRNPATGFVYDVIELINSECLNKLKGVTTAIVTDRLATLRARRATSDN